MSWRVIKTDQQICYRALCGMKQEADKAVQSGRGVRAQIVCLAMQGMRSVSQTHGHCDDCPYKGQCDQPDESNILETAEAVES